MQITEAEYGQLMNYIATDIRDIKQRYNSIQATKDAWDDPFNPTSKTSGLTLEEMTQLQADMVARQHELFRAWHRMNQRLREEGYSYYLPDKLRELGSCILHVTRYGDVLNIKGGK